MQIVINRRTRTTKAALTAILAILIIGSTVIGRYSIGIKEVFGILISQVTGIESYWTSSQESIFWLTRLPRIIMACLIGAALSHAGAVFQGVFQNPMAAPDILGASSGAAFGASLAMLLNLPKVYIISFSFISGLLCVFLVMFFGHKSKGKRVVGLVLSGIMVSSLFSSGTSFVKLVADPQDQLPNITYWLMGSVNKADYRGILFLVIPLIIGTVPMFLLRWRLNILSLGEEEARTLGVNTKRLRTVLILSATLVTAACVSVSGVIGWVGLVIPHLARKMIGNDYRHLLPASGLLGAAFLLLVDDVSRTVSTTEIPIGILTAFIGAPFFIYLLTKDGERL